MRKLIVIAVILLAIATAEINGDFKFGDIIAFPRTVKCPCKTFTYTHYAVYVGDRKFPNKEDKHNIFQRDHLFKNRFGTLKTNDDHHKDNYLDGVSGFTVKETDITARIQEKLKLELYGPFKNNCEHLATYLRYGVKISIQRGKDSAKYCKNDKKINIDDILKKINQDQPEECEYACSIKKPTEDCGSCSIESKRGPG